MWESSASGVEVLHGWKTVLESVKGGTSPKHRKKEFSYVHKHSSTSFEIAKDPHPCSSSSSSFRSLDFPRVVRRHHHHQNHSQYYKPYEKPRRFSLQLGSRRSELPLTKDLCFNFGRNLSLSDSEGSSGTASGTGTPPPQMPEYRIRKDEFKLPTSPPLLLQTSPITTKISVKEDPVATVSNPNSPIHGHSHKKFLHYYSLPTQTDGNLQLPMERQRSVARSKSFDDLSLLGETSSTQHRLQSHHLPIPIINQSSASCDIETVIQRITSLEM